MTRASWGIWTSPRLPIAVMAPPDVTTTVSGSGAASGEAYTLPPTRASVCAFAAALQQVAPQRRKKKSATRSQFPIIRGPSNLHDGRLVQQSLDLAIPQQRALDLIVLAPPGRILMAAHVMPRHRRHSSGAFS